MRLTDKDKIKELLTLEKHKITMTDNDYKELKLGKLEDILEGHNIETLEELDGLLWYAKQIKDIKDELGIDLITLLKASESKVFVKFTGAFHDLRDFNLDIKNRRFIQKYTNWDFELNFKDYGKTWGLEKDFDKNIK